MQQGGRPGGARFAQFKLVLLGMALRVDRVRAISLTPCRRVGGRKELTGTAVCEGKTGTIPTSPEDKHAEGAAVGPIRRLPRIHNRRRIPHTDDRP
jgi:hypothetical protein